MALCLESNETLLDQEFNVYLENLIGFLLALQRKRKQPLLESWSKSTF